MFNSVLFAQTDWVKWNAAEVAYARTISPVRNYQIDHSNSASVFLTGAVKLYHVLISDVDGDNCPFYPSCSEFFSSAVKETNIIQGGLMFIDRFTRDINFFKSRTQYPFHESGKLFDPVVNYTLNLKNINYILHGHIVKKEN